MFLNSLQLYHTRNKMKIAKNHKKNHEKNENSKNSHEKSQKKEDCKEKYEMFEKKHHTHIISIYRKAKIHSM